MQLIGIPEIAAKAKVGRRTAFDVVKRPGFPVPRRLGSRILRWVEHEVDTYLLGLPPATDRIEPPRLTAAKAARRGGIGGAGGVSANPESSHSPEAPRQHSRRKASSKDEPSAELEKVAA